METQLGCADPTESTHSEFCRVAKKRMRTGGNDRVSGDYERSGHHGSPAIFFRSGPGIFLIPGTGRGNPPSWDFLQPEIFLETWDFFGNFCEIF